HRLPVMSALGAGTDLKPLADFLLQDVAAVGWLSGLGVDAGEQVLIDRLFMTEKLAGFAIDFPQNSGLADREQKFLAVEVHQNAFENLIHIEGLARRMLKIPLQAAGIGIERDRGTREQSFVARLGATADTQPGFG